MTFELLNMYITSYIFEFSIFSTNLRLAVKSFGHQNILKNKINFTFNTYHNLNFYSFIKIILSIL